MSRNGDTVAAPFPALPWVLVLLSSGPSQALNISPYLSHQGHTHKGTEILTSMGFKSFCSKDSDLSKSG